MQCIGLIKGKIEECPGTFVSSTELTCDVPAVSEAMQIMVGVSFSKKEWTRAQFKKTFSPPYYVDVAAPAPALVNATLEDNLRGILLEFDRPAWPAVKKCQDLFTPATVNKLGAKRLKCRFKSKQTMRIYLTSKSSIQPGDTIGLKAGVIKSRFSKVSDTNQAANVVLAAPGVVVTPVADITAPAEIGTCEHLKISGGKSSGSGGKVLTYIWGVEFASGVDVSSLNSNETDDLQLIKDYIAARPSYAKRLKINSPRIAVSSKSKYIAYNFTLTVQNFLGGVSEQVHTVVSRISSDVPTVRILGPKKRRVKTSKLNKFVAFVRLSKCQQKAGLSLDYQWEIDGIGIDLDAKSKLTKRLYVDTGTFVAGETYELTFVASLKSDPSVRASSTINIEVASSPLVARIKGGNRVVGSNANFTLDASKSFDPDLDSESAWYEWECFDKDDVPCFAKDPNNADEYDRLTLPENSLVTVNSALMESNQTYKFRLHYSKGFRSSSKDIKVRVKPGVPPVVVIRNPEREKENPDKRVVIRGGVQARKAPYTHVWWECVSSDDESYAFVDFEDPDILLMPYNHTYKNAGFIPIGLVFKEGALAGGATYMFRLNAESADGTGYAEVEITTNAAPTQGLLETDVSTGTALTTPFTLTAATGWEDDPDDLPLTYNFGYYSPTDGKKQSLGAPTTENEMQATLPTGVASKSNNLTLFVEVKDNQGAMTLTEFEVNVNPPDKIDSNAIEDASSTINDLFAVDDLSSAVGGIISTLSVYDDPTLSGKSCLTLLNC